MKRAKITDIVLALRSTWMPKLGIPAILPDSGSQFTASIIQYFFKRKRAREIYSTSYRLQGNSIVESFMEFLKKGLAALVSEKAESLVITVRPT